MDGHAAISMPHLLQFPNQSFAPSFVGIAAMTFSLVLFFELAGDLVHLLLNLAAYAEQRSGAGEARLRFARCLDAQPVLDALPSFLKIVHTIVEVFLFQCRKCAHAVS